MDQLKHFTNEVIAIHGRNAALNASLENLNEVSNLITWGNNVAAKLQVSSSSAADKGTPTASTGARTLFIIGLDANYRLQTELVTLDGQTAVETTASFLRVFAAECTLCGTGLVNAGDIYVYVTGQGGTPSGGVPSVLTSCWVKIPVGYGYNTSGMFTVPLGENVRLERLHASGRSQQTDLQIGKQMPWSTIDNSYHIEVQHALGAPQAIDFTFPLPTSHVYPEKTDIYMRVSSATAAGVATATMYLRRIGPSQRGGQGVVAPQ